MPTSRVGCLIGKGGSIINEMRRITQANIRVLTKESLPKVAAEDDEMVQVKMVLFNVANVIIVRSTFNSMIGYMFQHFCSNLVESKIKWILQFSLWSTRIQLCFSFMFA